MAGNSLSLVWDLIARDGASPVFDRVAASADKAAASTEAAAAKTSAGFSTAAKVAGAAGLVFAAASVKMAADFQSSTTRLVTSANESQKNLKMVQQGMLDMAGQLGYSTSELSAAMYKVESGGQHGAAGLATLKAAAQGAKTENADLTTVADALTSAMTDYHLKASDAATVTSKLVAATASGKMTFEELAGSLSAILPVASANHVALNDILGDLASMTMHGMSAEQASQNLADAIRHLAAPTQQQQKEFAALGLTAQQITADLGTKGLSGTINVIGDAIKAQMGPGTSQVVLDLSTALEKLPAPVKDLGQKILDGTISLGEYRQAMKALPAEQAIAAQSFMGLVSSTHQIGNETKNGAEIYQSYSGALRQALGDATGMNVALMIGGENAGNTAKAIANVSNATADAKGNVKGWSDIQGTFNQQASETLHSLEAMTIEAGMHLLPALTSAMGYINRDVIPGIKGLGSGISDAVRWFGSLPAPVKEATLALAALKVITSTDMFAGLVASGRVLAVGFANDMSNMVASARAGAGSITAAFAEAKAAQQALTMEKFGTSAVAKATGDLAGLGAAAGAAARGGLAAMRSAGSSLVDMLGGPWVLAAAAATAGVVALVNSSKAHTAAVKAETDSLVALMKAQEGGGAGAQQASDKMDAFRRRISDLQHQIDAATTAQVGGGKQLDLYGGQHQAAGDRVAELRNELAKAKDAMSSYHSSLTPLQTAQNAVTQAQNNLTDALKHNAPESLIVADAAGRLHDAQNQLATATNRANDAQKTQAQRMQEAANAALASLDAQRQAKLAQLDLADAVDQYNRDVKSGTVSSRDLQREELNMVGQAEAVAKAASDAAVQQAKQNGATDTGTASQVAYKQALQIAADQMTGPSRQAVEDIIAKMGGAASVSDITAAHFEAMGVNVTNSWKGAAVEVAGATASQIKNMQDLGYWVLHLPNGHIVVSADTNPAQDEINRMLIAYRSQVITLRSQMPDIPGVQRMGAPATGGWISGPGTGTSDTAGVFRLSDGEFVVNAAAAQANAVLLAAINGGARVHTSGVPVPGYATGGWVGQPPSMEVGRETVRVHMDTSGVAAQLSAALAPLKAAAASGGSGGAARWSGLVLQALAMMGQPASLLGITLRRMNQESGGNPNAINLWDINAQRGYPSQGLMQVIGPTFAANHFPGTSFNIRDPLANVLASMRYALARYGSLSAAYGRVGGYKLGTNYVPNDGLAMLHKGEAVVPADKNQGAPYSTGPTVFNLYDADGVLMGTMRGHAEAVVGATLGLATQRGQYNG